MAESENIKETRNDAMKRKEVEMSVDVGKTPSFAEASKMISEQFKAPEENIMIENVKGGFGRKSVVIRASIYDTKELKAEAVKRLIKPKKAAPGAAAAE